MANSEDCVYRVVDGDTDLATWLSGFRPKGVPPERWRTSVRPFVAACLDRLGLGDCPAARRYARVLARFGSWCLEDGLPLELEVVLDPAVVERYAAVVLRHQRGGATHRSDLRRIGRAVTRKAPWEPRPEPLARRNVAAPYAGDDLGVLWHVVDHQSTRLRRQAGRALFLLGIAAGLDGRWVMDVTVDDIAVTWGRLCVAVGEPHPRYIPIRSDYASRLVALLREVPTGRLVGSAASGKNAASRVVDDLHFPPGTPRLSLNRLRATWLTHHLNANTRVPELLRAAGLDGMTVLSDLLPDVPSRSFDAYCIEIARPDDP